MKGIKILSAEAGLLFFASLVPICGVGAATSTTPYHGIVERNVFDLRAPVVVAGVPLPNPIVLPKITLTGITTIFGRTIAFITIAGDKPGQLPESVMLTEGQVVREIEVKLIDYRSGIVQVVNHGQAQTLDFEHDGAKTPAPPSTPHISFTSFPPPSQPMPSTEPSLSREEQMSLIEIQREKFRQENDPVGQILPPTEMTTESR